MLSQMVISLAGLIDRAMVGRLAGDEGAAVPLAAVGFATQFFFFIQSTLFAVGLACIALMSRAIGARDPATARAAQAASIQVSLVTTVLLAGGMFIGARDLLALLGAEPAVIDTALPYLQLVLVSSLMLAVAIVIDSALRANRDMRTPMWVAIAITVVKLAGNWVLIFGNLGAPRLGVLGAGLATVLSQAIGLAIFLAVVLRQPAASPSALRRRDWRAARPLRRDVIRIAAPGIAERVIMNLAMLSYFWVLSRYGTVSVAAYTVGIALLSFSWIPGTAYAQACATLVGQSLGAGQPEIATQTGWRCAGLAVVTAVLLGGVVALARRPLAELFTQDVAVVEALGPFMLALALAQPFLQLHFTLGGAHRGAGDTWTPLVAATVGNWIFRIPLAVLFSVVLELDVVWVWNALIVDHVGRAIVMVISYQRGRWISTLERRN